MGTYQLRLKMADKAVIKHDLDSEEMSWILYERKTK